MCSLIPTELATVIHQLFKIFWVLIIVLLIIVCFLDIIKILSSQDEKEIRHRQSLIIKRILIVILIFLFIYILQFIFGILKIPEANEAMTCAKKIILGK